MDKIKKKYLELDKQLKAIIDIIPGLIYCKDNNDTITFVNQNYANFLKKEKKDIIGKKTYDLFPEKYAKEFSNLDKEILKTRKAKLDYEVILDYPDDKKYFLTSKVPLINENNKIDGILGLSIDITGRKKIEEKLKYSEEMFSKAFYTNHMVNSISEYNTGRFVEISDLACKNLGMKKEDILGKSPVELGLWPDNRDHDTEIRKILDDEGSIINMPINTRTKDGHIRHGLMSVYKITINNKPYMLNMVLDITDRVRMENKLKKSEERYRMAFEHENFYKTLFTHDMNNILQTMLLSLELAEINLENLEKNGEIEINLNDIKDQIIRGANLVENVIKFSELDYSKEDLIEMDIIEVLKKSINIARKISKKKIEISIHNDKKKIIINADEFLLDVFENILINSVKHNINEIIKIEIKIIEFSKNRDKFLKLEFKDNGRGITQDNINSLFSKMNYSNDRSVCGMGFGLRLVKRILDRYNASIEVRNNNQDNLSEGTTFILTFPLCIK
ncbi:MAG: PAS domain S-box protein [Candidatus Lokiarchaeota archaeon]|nr:PAS domain S-box protein [Candidatus Lokiarchaeota archaeon]